ncbi:MAG: methyltransferase [Bacteroidales bacterium]
MGESRGKRESKFRFKQFSVVNKDSAMKVGTDGVLLGAWCDITEAKKILDIGTGTGLIALMAAQRNQSAYILAIEIDSIAANEASDNFINSPWNNRLELLNIDFNNFSAVEITKFDHIISNPPFYTTDIHSPNDSRAAARHSNISLTFSSLLTNAKTLLTPETGKISIITPTESAEEIEKIAHTLDLHISRRTEVYPKQGVTPKRILWELTNTQPPKQSTQITQLTIELGRHIYTPEYITLTKPFYLKM